MFRRREQRSYALTHFFGGFVGEGNGKDVLRPHSFFQDEMSCAMGKCFCFSASGSGDDEYRAFGGLDGAALFRVEGGVE